MARYAWGPHHPISIILPPFKTENSAPCRHFLPLFPLVLPRPRALPGTAAHSTLPVDRILGPRPTGSIFQLPRYPCVFPCADTPPAVRQVLPASAWFWPPHLNILCVYRSSPHQKRRSSFGAHYFRAQKKSSDIKATALSCTLYWAPSVRFAY